MCSILLLFGCDKVEEATLEEEPEPGIFGEQELFRFNIERETETTTRSPIGLGVNGYLWRATLETLSFLPIASADPFGGLIITEWYSPPETPNERFKLNIHILSPELRANTLKVSIFRQIKQQNEWRDTETSKDTVRRIEEQILTKARNLRISTTG